MKTKASKLLLALLSTVMSVFLLFSCAGESGTGGSSSATDGNNSSADASGDVNQPDDTPSNPSDGEDPDNTPDTGDGTLPDDSTDGEEPDGDDDKTYSITYTYDSSKVESTAGLHKGYNKGDSIKLSAPVTVNGYDFVGWFNADGEKISEITSDMSGDLQLSARITLTVYKINYNMPSGIINSAKNADEYTVESPTLTLADATSTVYTFIGWADADGNAVKSIEAGSTGDIEIYAKWRANRYVSVPVSQIKNPLYSNSFRVNTENNLYTFVYYLGYVYNVPLTSGTAVNYPNVSVESYTTQITTEESIQKSISEAYEKSYSESISISIGVSGSIGYGISSLEVSSSISGSQTTQTTSSSEQSISTVVGNTNSKSETLTMNMYPNDPEGYYRMVHMGTLDMFVAVVYDAIADTYEVVEYSILRPDTAVNRDYSPSEAFDDHVVEQFEFEKPDEIEEYLVNLTQGTDGLIFKSTSDGYVVTGYNGDDSDVIIPTYYKNEGDMAAKKVIGFEDGAFRDSEVKSVTLGMFMDTVADYTFYNCKNLEHIYTDEYGASIKEIGNYAFYGCESLDFEITETVTAIGEYAFCGCVLFDKITVTSALSSIGTGAFEGCGELSAEATPSDTVISSLGNIGATVIIIDLSEISDTCSFALDVADSVTLLEINGAGRAFENVSTSINSSAQKTVIKNVSFIFNSKHTGAALTVASAEVMLHNVSIDYTASVGGSGIIFTADTTDLYVSSSVILCGGDATEAGNGISAVNINVLETVDSVTDSLTVSGGNGNMAGCGIYASGAVTVSGNITLSVTGGNGSKGYDGNCGDDNGTNGENGGNGYAGGIGISANEVQLLNATVTVDGGNGGKGGAGGCCNPNGVWVNGNPVGSLEVGGNGGTGGAGGIGISANSITVSGGSLSVVGGDGGQGGDRGGIYDGADGTAGGANGNYGSGGSGASATNDDCVIADEQGVATFTSGINGSAGTGSDCRDH